jgi:hypothetical protein
MSLIWAWLFGMLGADPGSAERGPGDDCDPWECGSNGTSETGLVRPAQVGSVELGWGPGGGCSGWECGTNGASETGLVRPATAVSAVALPVSRR